MMKVLAIIPARSGSKSILDKNIRIMNGKPLMAYSIEQALSCRKIDRVIVSTDSHEYRDIALSCGADVPFIRPKSISGDASLDIEVFEHALNWLRENEGICPGICVHLRPTHPIRDVDDIEAMINMLEQDSKLDSVRSVSLAKQTPYKMWRFCDDKTITPVATCGLAEAYNAPRQALPEVYMQNACIDVVRTSVILNEHSMTGKNIGGYKMKYDFDIDSEDDFLAAEQIQLVREKKQLKICCDIDGVLMTKTHGNEYTQAKPILENIAALNALFEKGHEIVLFTARGYATGKKWEETTERQLKQWGVCYNQLLFGKPDADVYIDDKLMSLTRIVEALK